MENLKKNIVNALLLMGKKHIKDKLSKTEWSIENPTRGYCYVVSEYLHFFVFDKKSEIYKVEVDNETSRHYFLKHNNEIIDFTAEQFKDKKVDYTKAVKTHFIKPSKRAMILNDTIFNATMVYDC